MGVKIIAGTTLRSFYIYGSCRDQNKQMQPIIVACVNYLSMVEQCHQNEHKLWQFSFYNKKKNLDVLSTGKFAFNARILTIS